MQKINDDLYRIDDNYDLVFSWYDEEQDGRGWYIQRHTDDPNSNASQCFETKEQALHALKNGELTWG